MATQYGYSGFNPMSQSLMSFGTGNQQNLSFGTPTGPAPAASANNSLTVGSSAAVPYGVDPQAFAAFNQKRFGTASDNFDSWSGKSGFGKTFTNMDGSMNFNNIGSVVQGIGALGSLWAGIQANKVAKDSLNFQKEAYQTNLANQIQSYNTALEDRANNRAAMRGGSAEAQAGAESYINKHRLGS